MQDNVAATAIDEVKNMTTVFVSGNFFMLHPGHALEIESLLLRRRARYAERTLSGIDARLSALTRRA